MSRISAELRSKVERGARCLGKRNAREACYGVVGEANERCAIENDCGRVVIDRTTEIGSVLVIPNKSKCKRGEGG